MPRLLERAQKTANARLSGTEAKVAAPRARARGGHNFVQVCGADSELSLDSACRAQLHHATRVVQRHMAGPRRASSAFEFDFTSFQRRKDTRPVPEYSSTRYPGTRI